MSDPNVFQIMKSNAVLWYSSTIGEAVPDVDDEPAGAAWGGGWLRLGATKEPLSMLYEDERTNIDVEEFLASIQRYRTSEALTLETVLAEIDADYMALMTEGTVSVTPAAAGQKGYDDLPIGNIATLTPYAVGFEGINVNSSGAELTLRIFIYRANMKLGGELKFSKRDDDYTGVPITIEALSDSATPGRLYVIQKVTAPAS